MIGRANKQENLTKGQKKIITEGLNKSIKLRDCIKLMELSSTTLSEF